MNGVETQREALAREALELARDRAGIIRAIDARLTGPRSPDLAGYHGPRVMALETAIIRRANTLIHYAGA
jgi:hypothetical protein